MRHLGLPVKVSLVRANEFGEFYFDFIISGHISGPELPVQFHAVIFRE
jgi:hypothetical protein